MKDHQSDEGGWAGARDHGETWAEFDALPRGVKRVYWEAPYAYTAIGAVRAWRAGEDMRTLAEMLLFGHSKDLQRETRRLYGPCHPQASD